MQIRQLEVRLGVDEGWKNSNLPETRRVRYSTLTDTFNSTVLDRDHTVSDWSSCDGQEPVGGESLCVTQN